MKVYVLFLESNGKTACVAVCVFVSDNDRCVNGNICYYLLVCEGIVSA